MGVSQPINQNHNVEGMQLTCSKCNLIPKILNLDYNNYSIAYECPKHGIKTEDIKEYIKSSKKYLSESNRNNNSENINDENQNQIFFYCIDTQFLEKLKNKKKEIEEKIENEKCINELLNRLITMYEGQNNDLNKNNLIKVYEKINENGSEELLKKIENLENKISYYLEKKIGKKIEDNAKELNLNGKNICELDLFLLKESNINLKNLVKLDLGNNDIRDIGILIEFNLPNLRTLNLEHNKIEKIDNLIEVLKVNRKIETINLSHNLINKVDVNKINDNAFQYVKEINLDGNNEIKQDFEEIKNILKINKKIQNYENCILKYKIEEEETKIFGSEFVSYNANKCRLFINGKEKELCDNYINKQGKNQNNYLYVKMLFKEAIVDISNIFDGCTSLISISDNISKWNISKVTKMNRLFNQCISLESLPDISQWDTSNVTTMERLFNQCYSLKSLPDIGKWNTSKVNTMEGLFYQCKSLTSLPNISGWDTTNVTNMNYLFYHCNALESLPNIGNWNLSNVITMFYMFSHCESLVYLPDLISGWNTSNVQNMSNMFSGCSSLEHLPDISNWDFSNVVEKVNMFDGCTKLKPLPHIP